MAALKFDDVDDRLRWTTLTTALQNVSNGAWTVAALLKREAFTTFDAVTYLLSGSGNGVEEAGFSIKDSDVVLSDVDGVAAAGTVTIVDTDVRIIAVSKGAGTVAPRIGYKNLTAATAWSHEAAAVALPDQTAATMLDIGVWQGVSDPFDGWIGLVGWWEGAMSDGQKETLSTDKRTSDWWLHSFGTPVFLAELNVAAGSVSDIAGNASAASHVGTSLDSGEALESWNFDGMGGGADMGMPVVPAGTFTPGLVPETWF